MPRDNDNSRGDDEEVRAKLRAQLEQLTIEHGDLDAVIAEMVQSRFTDMLRLGRLKRRKLAIKDEIRALNRRLLPDIIA